jgi:hypothetical protein
LGSAYGEPMRYLALGEIALVARDHEAAAAYLREACDAFEAVGNVGELSTYTGSLGGSFACSADTIRLISLAQRGRELGDPQDVMTQHAWRGQALVHSARGQHPEAEELARQAVDL